MGENSVILQVKIMHRILKYLGSLFHLPHVTTLVKPFVKPSWSKYPHIGHDSISKHLNLPGCEENHKRQRQNFKIIKILFLGTQKYKVTGSFKIYTKVPDRNKLCRLVWVTKSLKWRSIFGLTSSIDISGFL